MVGAYPVCASCSSKNVVRDAWAKWSRLSSEWVLKSMFDEFACDTKAIIRTIEDVAKNTSAGIYVVDRKQMFKNNIDEARQFAEQYPELKAWLPSRPKLWESEPRNIIYFEALALAKQALGNSND
ncbi:MAG: hypothetical protein L3J37_06445 [Rhodobacteraceae bacterium]|nr:hypothetical protein [Paracoccaceae bacterium]